VLDALTLPRSLHHSPWPARLGVAAALALCVWQAVGLLWLMLAGAEPPAAAPVEVPAVTAPAASTQGEVAKWHLFGDAQVDMNRAAVAQAQLQETALKLVLRGTFNESRPDGGIAIIADEQGVDRAYRVGDALPGDARLEQILAGQIVLSRGGVSETLSLRITGDSLSPAVSTGGRALPARLPGAANTPLAPGTFAPVIAPGMPDMETYRAANLPNVQELAKQVQVFPVFANGRMQGVRLGVGRDSDLLSRAGLRPTDVVTSVNGIPLDGPARQMELLSALRDARSLQIEVERDGKPVRLQLGL
jgi:general secretion pathway protein C